MHTKFLHRAYSTLDEILKQPWFSEGAWILFYRVLSCKVIFRADGRFNGILLNSGVQHNVLSSLPHRCGIVGSEGGSWVRVIMQFVDLQRCTVHICEPNFWPALTAFDWVWYHTMQTWSSGVPWVWYHTMRTWSSGVPWVWYHTMRTWSSGVPWVWYHTMRTWSSGVPLVYE